MRDLRLFWEAFMQGFKGFGYIIIGIINFVLLSLVYFIGIGLTSIVAKIFRKHFLQVKLDKDVESHWEPLNLGKRPQEEYYRQF